MLILFCVDWWTRDGLRSVESRYGDLPRLDAWLTRLDAGDAPLWEDPRCAGWRIADRWLTPFGLLDVIEHVTGVSPALRMSGPAPSDLDERGVCRCGCMDDPHRVGGRIIHLVGRAVDAETWGMQ